MIRKEKKYTVQEILSQVIFDWRKTKKVVDGDIMKMSSKRLQVFAKKGITCVKCGLKGAYFYKEKNEKDGSYHFNLYGVRNGKEILFTKDHIRPKSKLGNNSLDNLQTMCTECNKEKGNTWGIRVERKLATIQKIKDIYPIDGADSIDRATILGWNLVVKKGEFKSGDWCVYCEVDSLLPIREEFEFLRKSCYNPRTNRFRIKTAKLRGQISQGIAFPLSILGDMNLTTLKEGDDVTDLLNIIKYEPPIPSELGGDVKGSFPSFIPKTDEIRIQSVPSVLERHKGRRFVITEKVDGCVHEDEIINTEDGPKTIKEVCDSKYTGKVESFNHETNNIEYHKILNHSIKENINNWYEIETENGKKVVLTEDHYVWVEDIKAYRKVSELNGNETILLKK